MKNKRNRKTIAFLLLLLMLLPACGRASKQDGIDSVTILSDLSRRETDPDPESVSADKPINSDPDGIFGVPLARCHENSFSSSLYMLFVIDALDETASRYGADPSSAAGYDVMLEDGTVMSAEEYCRFYADTEFSWACLLITTIEESGHELKDCRSYEAAAREAYSRYQSDPALYSRLSVSLEDLIDFCLYPSLYEDLFYLLYGPDGDSEISADVLESLMESGMRKIRYTYLPFYDDQTQEEFTESEIRDLTALSEQYLVRYRNGESFEEIVAENYMYLDAFHVIMDPERTELYYSPYDSGLPISIIEFAEALKPYEADILVTEDFTSVVQRLPVNENRDSAWYDKALSLAYETEYGSEYAEKMTIAYDSADIIFDETVHSQLTAHFYSQISEVEK